MSTTTIEHVERLPMSGVLERDGWTRTAIDRFLGEPDELKRNPHYKCAAPMRLYDLTRVEAAEQTPEFAEFEERSKRRRESARRAAAMKREALLAEASQFPVVLKCSSNLDKVREQAKAYWEAWQVYRYDRYDAYIGPDAPQDFIDRITMNYLRHNCSNYEELLAWLHGRVGTDDAYWIVKRRVHDAIAKRFPELAHAC